MMDQHQVSIHKEDEPIFGSTFGLTFEPCIKIWIKVCKFLDSSLYIVN